jgi:hypothetical protein
MWCAEARSRQKVNGRVVAEAALELELELGKEYEMSLLSQKAEG